jgi:hypothetical protein
MASPILAASSVVRRGLNGLERRRWASPFYVHARMFFVSSPSFHSSSVSNEARCPRLHHASPMSFGFCGFGIATVLITRKILYTVLAKAWTPIHPPLCQSSLGRSETEATACGLCYTLFSLSDQMLNMTVHGRNNHRGVREIICALGFSGNEWAPIRPLSPIAMANER